MSVLLLFSCSVVPNSLWPHRLQHARLPCPSPSPSDCSDSCPLSQWCHPTVSSCHPLHLPPSVFLSIRFFSNELAFRIRWPKHWSFSSSISPSNEYSGLISFRKHWFDILAVQGTLSLLKHHSSNSSEVLKLRVRPVMMDCLELSSCCLEQNRGSCIDNSQHPTW